jgi:cytoskeleton protein RodZ
MNEPVQEVSMAILPASAGGMLKAARQKSGLHLAVLSANLKVSIKQLEALEADQFEQLLEPVFARALAAKVCRILKIDAAPVLALMPQMTNGLKPLNLIDSENAASYKLKRSNMKSSGLAFGGFKFWLLILALGILLFGYTAAWEFNFLRFQSEPAVTEVIPTMPPTVQEPAASDASQAELPKAMVFESATPLPNSTPRNKSTDSLSSN